MTWGTTHIGISTTLLYLLSTDDFKKKLKENPKLFFTLSLAAILPDLDIFFGLHRSLFHSLFFPISFMLLAPLLRKYWDKSAEFERNLIIFGIMWFSHTIFDLTFSGPVALFYPIDTRFYEFTMGFRLNLNPIFLSSLFIKVKFIDESIAINSFLVNQSVETRTEQFGQYIDVPVSQFPVHAAIFGIWFFLTFVPYLRYRHNNKKSKIIKNKQMFIDASWRKKVWFILTLPYTIIVLSLFLVITRIDDFLVNSKLALQTSRRDWISRILIIIVIMSSIYAGPSQGKTWNNTETFGDQYVVLTDFYRFNGFRTFSVPEKSILNITVIGYNTTIDFSFFAIAIDKNQANQSKNKYDDMISSFYDRDITGLQLINNYQIDIAKEMQDYPKENIQNITSEKPGKIEFITTDEITIFSGLYSWNSSEYFAKSIYTIVSYRIDRETSFYSGIVVAGIFSLMLIISIFKKEKNTM